jgi:hypothetical protein
VRRFVYASSVAAYGFHSDNPVGMTEDWPTRPADRLFYAQEKAELEQLLGTRRRRHPRSTSTCLRPAGGARPAHDRREGPAAWSARPARPLAAGPLPQPARAGAASCPSCRCSSCTRTTSGQALLQCVVAAGPARGLQHRGDGVLTAADVARELGFIPLRAPRWPAQVAARTLSMLPLPGAAQWVEGRQPPGRHGHEQGEGAARLTPRFTGLEASAGDGSTRG